jgi:hypothetical protein
MVVMYLHRESSQSSMSSHKRGGGRRNIAKIRSDRETLSRERCHSITSGVTCALIVYHGTKEFWSLSL